MKISNKLFSEQQVSQFSKQMENVQKIQSKISTGKNIIFASDDPVGAVQLSGLNDVKSKMEQYIDNANLALNRLDLMDKTLEASKNVFVRINELAIQASKKFITVFHKLTKGPWATLSKNVTQMLNEINYSSLP